MVREDYFVIRNAEGFNPSTENQNIFVLFLNSTKQFHNMFIFRLFLVLVSLLYILYLLFLECSFDSIFLLNRDLTSMSNLSQSFALMPWFVTGYSDGESSFIVEVSPNKTSSFGWYARLIYDTGALNNPINRK